MSSVSTKMIGVFLSDLARLIKSPTSVIFDVWSSKSGEPRTILSHRESKLNPSSNSVFCSSENIGQ